MKKTLFFLICIALIFSGCKDDDTPTGDLSVTVILNGYGYVKNANVYTNPPSVQGLTDQYGSVLLKGLEAGSYEVYASHDSIGAGKATVYVKDHSLNEVSINIIKGVFTGIAPVIDIILPGLPAEFSAGEEITFSAQVSDDKTAPENIALLWESDKDGVLNTSSPNSSGVATFKKSDLSSGTHSIKITATDADGFKSSRVFILSTDSPQPIKLTEAKKEDVGVVLKWEKYPGSDFQKYEVYRSDADCSTSSATFLTSITNIETVSFTDLLPPWEFTVCYHVKVINTSNKSRISNSLTVDNPAGAIFTFIPKDFLKHPTQNFLYLIDQGAQKLIKYDYTLKQIVQETTLQGTPGTCDIGDNGFGVEIYVPINDGWIYVYSADDLTLKATINVGIKPGTVVVNGLGHVITSLYPSPWWEDPVRSFSRATGILIDGNGDFEGDRLRMIPGKNEIISISTSVSPVDMEYFKLGSTGEIALHVDDTYHGDHPLDSRIFRISDNGEYTITGSEGAVYTANSAMEYRGQLQHGTLAFSDFAFSSDGSIIYAATSNRKSIQIGHYPSLVRDNEILTRGFPVFVIRDGNRLICLSKTSESSQNSGIEIIDL